MKFLDSTGLSTVIKYIKRNVPILGKNNKIPSSYLLGTTIPLNVANEVNGVCVSDQYKQITLIPFDENAMGGFLIIVYEVDFVGFVYYKFKSGDLISFYIVPIGDPKRAIADIAKSIVFICKNPADNRYYLEIFNVTGERIDIRPIGDRDIDDAVVTLDDSTELITENLISPEVI